MPVEDQERRQCAMCNAWFATADDDWNQYGDGIIRCEICFTAWAEE